MGGEYSGPRGDADAGPERAAGGAATTQVAIRPRGSASAEDRAQHVGQDAAVAVVLDLDRGVDTAQQGHGLPRAVGALDLQRERPLRRQTSGNAAPFTIGYHRAGNLLEVIVLHFDDGREMAIHAMPMRTQYRAMLPRPPEK